MNQETSNVEAGRLLTCGALLADSPTFKHVLDFAFRMESKLAKNRHKGDRDGWLKDHPWNLVERVLDETVEVQECFATDGAGETWLVKTPEETADECADVANFCMMTADRVLSANVRVSDPAATNQRRKNMNAAQANQSAP